VGKLVQESSLEKGCLTWRAHLSLWSAVFLVIASVVLAVAFLWIEGVYRDAPLVSSNGQLIDPSVSNPHPTFFVVREGDVLTLVRNRYEIANFLTFFFSGIFFLLLVGVYQSVRCRDEETENAGKGKGIGYLHLILPFILALYMSFMWLGAYPLVISGERIVLDPQRDSLLINGTRFASLHEINSFGREWGATGRRASARELFVANTGQGKWVVLDALFIGQDVLNARGGSPSVAELLTQYMREMHTKYPTTFGKKPWPTFQQ
jgi:hypothetical protein